MKVLDGLPMKDERLLVGPDSLDDAGVYQISEESALIQTVDFFTPLVDDPYDFGAIAAANALSDVYAMGGVPLTALAVMCFPGASAGLGVMREILRGGMEKMREVGAAVAGGHSCLAEGHKVGFAVQGQAAARAAGPFRRLGAWGPAFASIVGSGPHSCILHWRRTDRTMAAGEVVLIDVGAEVDG